MKIHRVSIQFHALPNELFQFASSVALDYGSRLTVARLSPFEVKEIPANDDVSSISGAFSVTTSDLRIHFHQSEVNSLASTENSFLDQNPGSTVLNVGNFTGLELGESSLMFFSSDASAFSHAKKIASKLKTISSTGIFAVDTKTGSSAFYKSHRYTRGAKDFSKSGGQLLPLAGNVRYQIPD